MRHTPTAALLLLLLMPAALGAQELRSGPNAPAASSQIPPAQPGPGANDRTGATGQTGAQGTQSTDQIRGVQPAPGHRIGEVPVPGSERRPPGDHRVLGGPPVPGAVQPRQSEGITTNRDVIPPNVGERVRPNAPTTDTGRR
jgi:hypothetical protein